MKVLRILTIAAIASSTSFAVSAGATTATSLVSARAQVAHVLEATLPIMRLTFSTPVAATRLAPLQLRPALATVWQQIGPSEVQAVATAAPSTTTGYTITVPTRLRCGATCTVAQSTAVTTQFATSVTWQEQLLAQLGYLPVSFTPSMPAASPAAQTSGTFTWTYTNLPTSLKAQWTPGVAGVILQGAIMDFQNVNNLPSSGVMDAPTWRTLVHDATIGKKNPSTYNYVDVTMGSPEVLTLYVKGVATMHALVNTGIPQAPTTVGTYHVYLRYISQTMRGTNPDGTTYNDPGIPWISYFHGGEALHGYIRSSYGFAQSLGCVEMPFATAGQVWPHTPIGTLVTVRP